MLFFFFIIRFKKIYTRLILFYIALTSGEELIIFIFEIQFHIYIYFIFFIRYFFFFFRNFCYTEIVNF